MDEPSNSFVDRRGVFGTFVERRVHSNLHNGDLASPQQTFACRPDGPIPIAVFFPVGGDKKDTFADHNLTVMDFYPSCWLGEPIFDADVTWVFERLGDRDDGFEIYEQTARPFGREDVAL